MVWCYWENARGSVSLEMVPESSAQQMAQEMMEFDGHTLIYFFADLVTD